MFNVAFFLTMCTYMLQAGNAVKSNLSPSVALCYNYEVPVTKLRQFDWAVVDADSNFNPKNVSNSGDHNTTWLVYLSMGEVTSDRQYYDQIPRSWIIGENTNWNAKIINQSAQGWSEFLVNKIAAPQWNRGFKGFFLDTLDSYELAVTTETQRQNQQNGLTTVILKLKSKFPNAIVIFNRGFEIMEKAHTAANMVAFESLYSGWDQTNKKYISIDENDRNELLERSKEIQSKYRLLILSIDYCQNEKCGKNTAERIAKHSIIPYVTDAYLQSVGIGPQNLK